MKEIDKQIDSQEEVQYKATAKLDSLKREKFKLETEPVMKTMVGNCYKYQSSYGSENEDWWQYTKILRYSPQARSFIICRFEKTSLGRIEISTEEYRYLTKPLSDYLFQVPITTKQFDVNLDRTIKVLKKMKGK